MKLFCTLQAIFLNVTCVSSASAATDCNCFCFFEEFTGEVYEQVYTDRNCNVLAMSHPTLAKSSQTDAEQCRGLNESICGGQQYYRLIQRQDENNFDSSNILSTRSIY